MLIQSSYVTHHLLIMIHFGYTLQIVEVRQCANNVLPIRTNLSPSAPTG